MDTGESENSLGDAGQRTFDGLAFTVKPGYENHPVTTATWFGARAYADFRGWRLPTEAQWEKAGHDPFERPGQVGDTTPAGFYNGRSYAGFSAIDSPSPYGLYDMAGNVAE